MTLYRFRAHPDASHAKQNSDRQRPTSKDRQGTAKINSKCCRRERNHVKVGYVFTTLKLY